MGEKIQEATPSKSRRIKTDLIDFSNDLDDRSGDNILELFDPLNHRAKSNHSIDKGRSSDRSTSVSESRRRDRRFRTSSTSTIISNKRNEIAIHSKKEQTASDDKLSKEPINEKQLLAPEHSSFEHGPHVENHLLASKDNSNLPYHSSEGHNDLRFNSADQPIRNFKERLKLSRKHQRSSHEIVLLTAKVKAFRAKYKHNDSSTNSGLIYSPKLYSSRVREMSVKVIITSPMAPAPLIFTCNVTTSIEHLISHAVCSMFESLVQGDSMRNYMLKVTGKDEYFDSKLSLVDYELASHCWKFDLDVQLTLVRIGAAKRPFLRTSNDDYSCKSLLCPDDLFSRSSILNYSLLKYEDLNIVMEAFECEADRMYKYVADGLTSVQAQGLLQVTKAICSRLMNCETSQLSDAKNNLAELCSSYRSEGTSLNDSDRLKMTEVVKHAIDRLIESVHDLLVMTSTSLPVDYEVSDSEILFEKAEQSLNCKTIMSIQGQVAFKICLICQLKPEWISKYQEFSLEVSLKHGNYALCPLVATPVVKVDESFFPRILFDQEISLPFMYHELPREARLVFTLYSVEIPSSSVVSNHLTVNDAMPLQRSVSCNSICSTAPMYSSSPRGSQIISTRSSIDPIRNKIATAIAYMFGADGQLVQGKKLAFMHDQMQDQIDIYLETIGQQTGPVLVIEFERFHSESAIYFPPYNDEESQSVHIEKLDFEDLDPGAKFVLKSIIYDKQWHELLADDEQSLLWDHRYYLTSIPTALPKVLLSQRNWSAANLNNIYCLLENWSPLPPNDAIQLMLPSFPDCQVRKVAVKWISAQDDDELCDYLPQLIQAFWYEKKVDCELFWTLLDRSLKNSRIANLLYWQLKAQCKDELFRDRCEVLMNCLRWACGSAFWKSTDKQEELLKRLASVSCDMKKARDPQRSSVLQKKLEQLQDYLIEKKPTMPWAPSLEICDLDINSCSYFASNTLPIKLAFRSCEESCNRVIKFHCYDTIFKMGDDLRQDMLAIQMIRIMDKLWLREGLDLRMVTFDCLATDERQGMVEVVQNAETLRKIQQSSSLLAGPFNSKAIDNYLRLWNTSELEYKAALDKFLHSCAGYSVATYVLGISDRHNDNIMITNSGHLFHIDFGKFLGDVQMLGSIKRDRTPFVLTADMAYVINGGDRPSKKFQTFIDLCTMSFNIIRRHRNLFLNLFALMSSAKIHGLNSDSVNYIDKMLLPNLTETEAMAKFTRLIEDCLKSRSSQVNFFIHNLAQLRFSNEGHKQSLLSFVPKTFTFDTDGEIDSICVVSFYKKYDPEKQYYYVSRVVRKGIPDHTEIMRTFREFSELEMKLSGMFPGYNFHDIQKSTSSFLMDLVGRRNTREIAERRLFELRTFVGRLLESPPEIARSDLVYTFFHPILRDQVVGLNEVSLTNEASLAYGTQGFSEAQRNALYLGSNGQIKLSLSYKNSSLIIMIMHAKNLACPAGSLGPNCYAKTYLLPDPQKRTKRKTRVVRQSCHPSFMELIVYEMDEETLKRFTLQVSIWNSEVYKCFMGAALVALDKVDLSIETTTWFPLKSF